MKFFRLTWCLGLSFAASTCLAQPNPVPFVNQPLVPAAVAPSGPEFSLTVNGAGFLPTSIVNWNGTPLATTFVSAGKLSAVVPAANLSSAGTVNVTVVNPGPGGGSSNSVPFTVIAPTSSLVFSTLPVTGTTSPISVVTADFNHDGIADLAVIDQAAAPSCNYQNHGVGSIAIFLGNGDGTFTEHSTLCFFDILGEAPEPLAVTGDLNRDGNIDLIATSGSFGSEEQLAIYYGNGDGTFTGPFATPVQAAGTAMAARALALTNNYFQNITGLALGDFYGNGQLNIAEGETDGFGNRGVLLLPEYDGVSVDEPFVAPGPLSAGDFNGDGVLDLADGNSSLWMFLNAGNGAFTSLPDVPFGEGTGQIVSGDFNGDGILDLATTNGNSISVLLGNGDGTFAVKAGQPTSAQTNVGLITADLNGDGILDLAVIDSTDAISIWLGNGDGTFQAPVDTTGRGDGVVAADFNGDGRMDLAVTNSDLAAVTVLLQASGPAPMPTFSPISPYSGAATMVAISDSEESPTITYCTSNSGTCAPSIAYTTSISFGLSGPTNICASANASGYWQSATACWAGTYVMPTCGNPSQNLPFSGTYNVPPTPLPMIITWTNPTAGCVLHYTTDGSTPTASSPTYPAGGLSIYSTTTIRVIAAGPGYNNSDIVGGKWTLNLPTCGDPTQNAPYSGTYKVPPTTLPMIITWTNPTAGCVMHYTMDGSAPTASSPTYPAGGLSIRSTTTIRVIAAGAGYNNSDIVGGKWTIK